MSKKNLLLAAVACLLGVVATNGSLAFAKATGGRGCVGCTITGADTAPVALEKATGGRGCVGCTIVK